MLVKCYLCHYDDVIMSLMAYQITSLTIVYSPSYSSVNQRKHQSSALLAFVRGIHRGPVNSPHKRPVTRSPVNSPHKRPVTRKMFIFDDIIMCRHWWDVADCHIVFQLITILPKAWETQLRYRSILNWQKTSQASSYVYGGSYGTSTCQWVSARKT